MTLTNSLETQLLVHGRRLPADDSAHELELTNQSSQNFTAFANYIGAMATKASTILQEGINEVGLYESIVVAVAEATVLLCVILAQSSWMYLPSSREYVLFAWLLGIFSPFIISLLPSTMFIQTQDLDEIIVRVIQESINFLSIDQAVEDCWTQLDTAVTRVTSIRASAARICSLSAYAPRRFVPIELTIACDVWDRAEEEVNWDQTEVSIRQFCTGLNALLFQDDQINEILGSDETQIARSEELQNLSAAEVEFVRSRERATILIRSFKERMMQFLHLAVAMQFAASKMMSLIPAALVMCPALIMSSFKTRLLLPLAKLPAIFLLVLPLIYCPLTWSTVSVAWQIIPEFFFLLFLVFQFFGMMVWTIEVIVFNFSEPMSRAHVNRVLKKMGGMSMVVTIGAIVFLLIWVSTKFGLIVTTAQDWEIDLSGIVWEALADLRREPPIFMVMQLSNGIIFKLWLSKVASFDFIVQNLTSEFEYAEAIKKMSAKMKRVRPEDYKDPEMAERLTRVNHIIQLDKEQKDALVALCELEAQSELMSFQGTPGTLRHRPPTEFNRNIESQRSLPSEFQA